MNSLNNLKEIKVTELSFNETKNTLGGSFLSTLVSVAVSVAATATVDRSRWSHRLCRMEVC
jgi:hypothetical protein